MRKSGYRKDEGNLSPEELEAAVELFKAQKAAGQASSETMDEGDMPDKNAVEVVRGHIDRRDSEAERVPAEEIIEEQKEDIEMLLDEIDRLNAENDMNSDNTEEKQDTEANEDNEENKDNKDNKDIEENVDTEEKQEPESGKVNMDTIDRMVKERLDICRTAEKLGLDGVDSLSVNEGKRRIVKKVNPKINLDGKSTTYINAAYDIAKQTAAEKKTIHDQYKAMAAKKEERFDSFEGDSDAARKRMIENMQKNGGK